MNDPGYGEAPASVLDYLVHAIVTDEMHPQQSIKIGHLAARLGLSATPVREALVVAETMGIVERRDRGYYIAVEPQSTGLLAMYEARMLVEGRTAWLAAEALDDGLLAQLKETHNIMRSTGESRERFYDFFEADRRFHGCVTQASGNAYYVRMLLGCPSHVWRFRRYPGHVTDAPIVIDEHAQIMRAIADGNAAAAKAAMEYHLAREYYRVELGSPVR